MTSFIVQVVLSIIFIDYTQLTENDNKTQVGEECSLEVVAGQIRRGRGPYAARGPPVRQLCATLFWYLLN